MNMTSYCSLLQSKQQTYEQKQNIVYPHNIIDYFLFMFLSAAFCQSEAYLIRIAKYAFIAVLILVCSLSKSFRIEDM